MFEAFRLGGWPMFPTAFFGLLLIGVALRYAFEPSQRWVPLQIALGILTVTMGGLGFVAGLIMTTTHVSGLEAGKVNQIALEGFGESLNNLSLALACVALAALLASVGTARAMPKEVPSD
jgi:hypothetical protein